MASRPRRRDATFLQLAAFAGVGGLLAIGVALYATIVSWRGGHPNSTFFFFGLWGIAALAGAAANVVVFFQSGDPAPPPPRGGRRIAEVYVLEARRPVPAAEEERKAA